MCYVVTFLWLNAKGLWPNAKGLNIGFSNQLLNAVHTLSVSAFDAAIDLAKSGRCVLSEALSIRGRAEAGRETGRSGGGHWDEYTGKQRLSEVMGRMQGPRELLEKLLLSSTRTSADKAC